MTVGLAGVRYHMRSISGNRKRALDCGGGAERRKRRRLSVLCPLQQPAATSLRLYTDFRAHAYGSSFHSASLRREDFWSGLVPCGPCECSFFGEYEPPHASVFLLEVLVLYGKHERSTCSVYKGEQHTGNLSPYIEKEPVPSPLMKSPPTLLVSTSDP